EHISTLQDAVCTASAPPPDLPAAGRADAACHGFCPLPRPSARQLERAEIPLATASAPLPAFTGAGGGAQDAACTASAPAPEPSRQLGDARDAGFSPPPRPAFTAAGWAAQDALRFWKTEFSKKMPAEKWEKQYAYGVRYNYGKEGKRADYTPYSCMKIIMSTPGEGDAHGCPYRNLKEDNLRAALRSMNLNNKAMDEVLDKVRNQHYQLACQSTFEGTHNCSCDVGINHPNQ
ncbi:hypothetical protein CYMTET_7405, partial [Cymbomonas tetramitiformis]